jgi:hypothetical protein
MRPERLSLWMRVRRENDNIKGRDFSDEMEGIRSLFIAHEPPPKKEFQYYFVFDRTVYPSIVGLS